ncbi:MAG: GHMP kinase [Gemmatimonadales bacterium]
MTVAAITVGASAPVRLDLAGAWTDVAPFAERERGLVINAAIELRTAAEVRVPHTRFELASDDLGERIEVDRVSDLVFDGCLDLHKAAVRRSGVPPCALRTRAEAPAGSGLGSSGALGVALVAALDATRCAAPPQSPCMAPEVIAETAWSLETQDAGIAGGKQDQYAAAIGGFQRLEFDQGRVRSVAIDLDPAFASELAGHTVLCYTGRSRFSGETIARVMRAYRAGDRDVTAALHAMVDIADQMGEALCAGDIGCVGELLGRNWREQLRLDACMCTPEMARLELAMTAAGAIGGKAAGAGTGGSMFFVVPGAVSPAITAARECGATILPVRWAMEGVRRC